MQSESINRSGMDEKLMRYYYVMQPMIRQPTNNINESLEYENVASPTGESSEGGEEKSSLMNVAKKVAVAVSGGSLILVGIPLIPLPGEFRRLQIRQKLSCFYHRH